jgi:hypothetical protein
LRWTTPWTWLKKQTSNGVWITLAVCWGDPQNPW